MLCFDHWYLELSCVIYYILFEKNISHEFWTNISTSVYLKCFLKGMYFIWNGIVKIMLKIIIKWINIWYFSE